MIKKSKTKAALFKRSSPTVGAFLDVISVSYHERYFSGLIQGAKEHDINLLCFSEIYYSASHVKNYNKINSMLYLANNKYIDGIINWASTLTWIITQDKFPFFFQRLKENPSYLKLQTIPNDMPITLMGSYEGMKKIIEHLIKIHGIRRIAFIRGPENHLSSIERYRAYIDTLKEYDIPFNPNLVTPPPDPTKSWIEETGEEMMNYLLDKGINNFDAVVSTTDSMAFGAINAMGKKNIKIPQDLAITGFDDFPLANSTIPTLTTINPQFEEMGRKSIDMFMNIFNNKNILQKQIVEPKLVIRQSCGCLDPVINQAEIKPDAVSSIKLDSKINLKKDLFPLQEKIITEIKLIAPDFDLTAVEKFKELFHSLIDDLNLKESKKFIYKLKEILQSATILNKDVSFWHQIISILRFYFLPMLDDNTILKAENFFHQARIMIGNTMLQINNLQRIYEKQQKESLQKIEEELIITFDINKLMDKLAIKLPALGIPSCFLSLFEGKKFPFKGSRLILAYNEKKRAEIKSNGIHFASVNLIPDEFVSKDRSYIFVIKPLYFQQEQLGFILFEIGPPTGYIYERLRSEISSAIKGAILLKKMKRHANELKKAYNELNNNQQKLLESEKKASLGRLISGIAHEMNTPLATIQASIKEISALIDEYKKSISNANVLPKDHEEISSEMMRYAEMITKASNRTASFIRGIKGQTVDFDSNTEEIFNAGEIITDALTLLDFKIKKNDCKLVTNLDDTIFLQGNPRWLSQIITNLVNNSIDASSNEQNIITVKLIQSYEKKAELSVQDTGKGISPENISRIFDPLFTTKPFGEATGLGLSIVKELINKFNGSINVASNPGLTKFIINLPISRI